MAKNTDWAKASGINENTESAQAQNASIKLVTKKQKEEKTTFCTYIPKSMYAKMIHLQASHRLEGNNIKMNQIIIDALEKHLKDLGQ